MYRNVPLQAFQPKMGLSRSSNHMRELCSASDECIHSTPVTSSAVNGGAPELLPALHSRQRYVCVPSLEGSFCLVPCCGESPFAVLGWSSAGAPHLAIRARDLPAADGGVVADLLYKHLSACQLCLEGLPQYGVEGLQGAGLPPEAAHHKCHQQLHSAGGEEEAAAHRQEEMRHRGSAMAHARSMGSMLKLCMQIQSLLWERCAPVHWISYVCCQVQQV